MKVGIYVPDDLWQRFQELRQKTTVADAPSVSEMVQESITKWVARHEKRKPAGKR